MKLKKWIKDKGRTQESFADDIGVSRGTLNRIVNGTPPGLKTARLIVKVTNKEISFNDIYS